MSGKQGGKRSVEECRGLQRLEVLVTTGSLVCGSDSKPQSDEYFSGSSSRGMTVYSVTHPCSLSWSFCRKVSISMALCWLMDFILLSESGLRALLGAFHLCSTMSSEFYLYTHNCKRHWFCIFLIFETHLSRVAMAMHNIISAVRPTMKARMIIQPGEMRTRGLEIHSFIHSEMC